MSALVAALSVTLLLCAIPLHAFAVIHVQDFVMNSGDHPDWANPAFDDSGWTPIEFQEMPRPESTAWLRTLVVLGPELYTEGRPLGIYFAALASHEVWWDGERIGRGGIVGVTLESETPGPVDAHYAIPNRLAAAGPHTLAIRTSAHHRRFRPQMGYWAVLVGDYDLMARLGRRNVRIALISLSGIIMMAVFSMMMFVQNTQDRSFLFLAFLCVTGALLLVAESYRNLFGYTYDWHIVRLVIVTALSWLLEVVLLVFLARRFSMSGAGWFVLVGAVAATIPIMANRSWDPKVLVGFSLIFPLATLWCAASVWRRLPGGSLALIGVGFCVAVFYLEPRQFLERNLYLALDFLFVCLLASHVLQIRKERMERENALLKSARLEIELLKKHIQPHFLMNTLTALSEWIEEEPQTAGKLIQSLGEEFRVLADISHKRLIRMEDEIRLCRSHLEIMSHRKHREYRMDTGGIDLEARIPPAVIHTLVENAITHGHGEDDRVEFRLSEERRDGRRCYIFVSPLSAPPEGKAAREGTGVRYIKARLQESFGQKWSIGYGADGSTWRTEIVVPSSPCGS